MLHPKYRPAMSHGPKAKTTNVTAESNSANV